MSLTRHKPLVAEQTPTPDATEKIDRFLAAERPDPPCLVVDLDVVRAKYAALRALFPDATLYYPKRKASESITGCARRTKAGRQGLSALGYGSAQLQALAQTINAPSADVVVSATPIDLAHLLQINKPIVRARYEFAESGEPSLNAIIDAFVDDKMKPLEAPGVPQQN